MFEFLLVFGHVVPRLFRWDRLNVLVHAKLNFLKVLPEEVGILFTKELHVEKAVDWTYRTVIVLVVEHEA